MRKLLPILIAAALVLAGCEPVTDAPTQDLLPAADPGRLLPVQAPQSQADFPFPSIGWDLDQNALIAVDKAHYSPTNIVHIDLDQLTATLLQYAPAGVAQLRSGGSGTILYTNSPLNDGTTAALRSVASGFVADISRVQFMLSDNGKWIVFHANGWRLRNLDSGTEVALPAMNDSPVAVSNDGARVAFGWFAYSSTVKILTVATGTVDSMSGEAAILDAAFSQSDLHLLTMTGEYSDHSVTHRFHDRSESGQVTGLGEWKTGGYGGANICAGWSHGPEPRTAVVAVQVTSPPTGRPRINFLRLGDTVQVVASADLWAATDCSVSPDGRWFVYGEATGNTGRLFLKKIGVTK